MTKASPPGNSASFRGRKSGSLPLSRRLTISGGLLLIGMSILIRPVLLLTDAEVLALANMGIMQKFAYSYDILITDVLWSFPFILASFVFFALHMPNQPKPPAA